MQTNLQFSEREYLRAKPKDTTFSEQRTLSLRKFTIHRKSFLRPFGSNACFCREKKRRAAVRAVASGAALPGFILRDHGDRLFEVNSTNSFKNPSP